MGVEKTKMCFCRFFVVLTKKTEKELILSYFRHSISRRYCFSVFLETFQHLGHIDLGYLGVYQEAMYLYCCVINVSLLSLRWKTCLRQNCSWAEHSDDDDDDDDI